MEVNNADGDRNCITQNDLDAAVEYMTEAGWCLDMDWARKNGQHIPLVCFLARQRIKTEERVRDEIEALRNEVQVLRRASCDKGYMIEALVSMLGPVAKKLWNLWQERGVVRVHYTWGAGSQHMTGEERAQAMLEWEDAPRNPIHTAREDDLDSHALD